MILITTKKSVEQYDSQCSESDRIKKERERILIAANGIKNVVECCINRMNDLNDLLINIKTTVRLFFVMILLIKNISISNHLISVFFIFSSQLE